MRDFALFFIVSLVLSAQTFAGQIGKILLIRHGEKDAKAKSGDVHLNERGEIRASALAELFFPRNFDNSDAGLFHFDEISSVVAQSATERHPSKRKIETARPIVDAGHVPLKLFDHQDISGTCEYLSSESDQGRTTLVVWDHTTISDLANELLRLPRGTIQWPMNRYDVVWEILPDSTTLRQYCQHLLFGDLWCPINPIQIFPIDSTYRRYIDGERSSSPVLT